MGQLLRNCRVGRGRSHWIAVRRPDAHCREAASRGGEAGAAFGSPTIVHFGATLFVSALLHVPWQTITIAATVWGLLGFSGVAYTVIVTRRMRKQAAYKPVFEDWLSHGALPLFAYARLALSRFAAPSYTREALFGVGGATLLLLSRRNRQDPSPPTAETRLRAGTFEDVNDGRKKKSCGKDKRGRSTDSHPGGDVRSAQAAMHLRVR
jgi:hypothetical protein